MAKINPDQPPRYYSTAQVINWTADADVVRVSSNINGLPPAISEYIAYDTLNPPNPFLAVTQDGNGNVIYDGGFPKFYNHSAPAANTPFSGLTGAYKFLYNGLNFVADARKTAEGNRKVLLVGDALVSSNYAVKSTAGSSFYTSFTRLCAIAGYTLTVKDPSDWGGVVNARYGELDEYCAVIVMSSNHGNGFNLITDASVQDFVTYRAQGGGLILITDHGPVFNSIAEATQHHTGFFGFANRLAVNFGAYFTGDYNRTAVNVGFLRSTYGDHPLYNGMLDSESIAAGGSESKVVVNLAQTYEPNAIPPTALNTSGKYVVNFLGILTNGDVVSYRYAYTVTLGEFLYPQRLDKSLPVERGLTTARGVYDASIRNLDLGLGTLLGRVYVEGVFLGTFEADGQDTQVEWVVPGLTGVPIAGPVGVAFQVDSPIRYLTEHTVVPDRPVLRAPNNVPVSVVDLKHADAAGLSTDALWVMLRKYQRKHFTGVSDYPLASALQTYLNEQHAVTGGPDVLYPELTVAVYPTQSSMATGYIGLGPEVRFAVAADTLRLMVKDPQVGWVPHDNKLSRVIPHPRRLVSSVDGTAYWFDGGSLTPQPQ